MAYKSWKPKGDNYISPKGIAFPIGMVIITATNINPTNWTYGTWQLFGQGKCLVGVDTSDSDFNTPLKTGGSKTVSYTPSGSVGGHTLTVDEIPSHRHVGLSWLGHDNDESITLNSGSSGKGYNLQYYGGCVNGQETNIQTRAAGGGKLHNHGFTGTASTINKVQPYITVYFWRRIS